MRRLLFATVAAASVCLSAGAHAADFNLYPVHALLIPAADTAFGHLAGLIEPQKAADDFVVEFKARFPNVTAGIAESERFKTYAVALQINRLSQYTVPKPDNTTDLYVAITTTLYFTNVVTGQNLFTYTSTSYRVKPVLGAPSAVKDDDVRQLVGLAYDDGLKALLEKAKANFKPYSKSYRVRGRYQDAYIVSGGALDGLRTDDELQDDKGASLKVVYAGDTYAIAQAELGAVDTSHLLSKLSTASLTEVKKPSLLVVPEIGTHDFDGQSVIQQFSDVIGDTGPFALTTVTPEFAALQNAVASETQISQQQVIERSLPDYFGTITLNKPSHAELPTNIPHKDLVVSNQILTFQVFDRTGHLVYADQGAATIKDEVVSGVRFDPGARAEVVMRNALMDVASRTKTLAFTRLHLRVTKADATSFQVEDPKGVLMTGTPVLVLTAVRSGPDPVWAPIWSAHIDATTVGAGTGTMDLPVLSGRPAIHSGDIVEVMQPASAAATKHEFTVCQHAPALGAFDMADFDDAAITTLVRTGKVAIREPERIRGVLQKLTGTGQFKAVAIPELSEEFCIEPAQKIEFDARQCASGTCSVPIHLTAGYRVKKAGAVVYRSALEQRVTSQSFFAPTSEAAAKVLLEADIEQAARKLLADVAAQKPFIDGLGGL
jgi:hypothetical protein